MSRCTERRGRGAGDPPRVTLPGTHGAAPRGGPSPPPRRIRPHDSAAPPPDIKYRDI